MMQRRGEQKEAAGRLKDVSCVVNRCLSPRLGYALSACLVRRVYKQTDILWAVSENSSNSLNETGVDLKKKKSFKMKPLFVMLNLNVCMLQMNEILHMSSD